MTTRFGVEATALALELLPELRTVISLELAGAEMAVPFVEDALATSSASGVRDP
jgi:hypothetical protein